MSEELKKLVEAIEMLRQQNDLILRRIDFLDAQIAGLRSSPTYIPVPNRSIDPYPGWRPSDFGPGLQPVITC